MSAEVRRQGKLDMMEEKNFRRRELLGKYTAKILYRWCQVHKWQTQFFSSLLLTFIFIPFYFSIFYFQNNQGQDGLVMPSHQSQPDGIVTRQITRLGRIQQKIQEQMTSYNMDTTCWPHGLHMVVQGRVHSSQHGPSVGLYKIDQFVEEFSIKFSCVTQYKSCSFI